MLWGWYGFRMKLVLGLGGRNSCDGLHFDKNGLDAPGARLRIPGM